MILLQDQLRIMLSPRTSLYLGVDVCVAPKEARSRVVSYRSTAGIGLPQGNSLYIYLHLNRRGHIQVHTYIAGEKCVLVPGPTSLGAAVFGIERC